MSVFVQYINQPDQPEKPWPIIAKFLESFPAGSIGIDSGTGNGKYLPLPLSRPKSVWTIGLDRSRNLLEFARQAGGKRQDVVWGDVLDLGWRVGVFVSTWKEYCEEDYLFFIR